MALLLPRAGKSNRWEESLIPDNGYQLYPHITMPWTIKRAGHISLNHSLVLQTTDWWYNTAEALRQSVKKHMKLISWHTSPNDRCLQMTLVFFFFLLTISSAQIWSFETMYPCQKFPRGKKLLEVVFSLRESMSLSIICPSRLFLGDRYFIL